MSTLNEIPDSARAPDGHLCTRCTHEFDEGAAFGRWVSCERVLDTSLTERARAVLAEHSTAHNVAQGNIGSTPVATIIDADGRMLDMVSPDVGNEIARLLTEESGAS